MVYEHCTLIAFPSVFALPLIPLLSAKCDETIKSRDLINHNSTKSEMILLKI